jgi:hypothetical protein
MKILLSICISLLVTSPFTIAQDSDFDDLTLNGLASYVKLRKEYYIGALYLEYRCNNCEDVTAVSGNKRMDTYCC